MDLRSKALLLINILIFYWALLTLIFTIYMRNIWKISFIALIIISIIGYISFNEFYKNKIIFLLIIMSFLYLLYLIYQAFQYNDVISFCPVLTFSCIIIDLFYYFLIGFHKAQVFSVFLLIYFLIGYIGIISFNQIIIETNTKYKHYSLVFIIFLVFLLLKNDMFNINKEYRIHNVNEFNEFSGINTNILFLENLIYGCVVSILLIPNIEDIHWLNPLNLNVPKIYTFYQVIIILSLSFFFSVIIYGFSEFLVTSVHNNDEYPYKLIDAILHEHFNCKSIYPISLGVLIIMSMLMCHYISPSHVFYHQIRYYKWNVALYYTKKTYIKNIKFSNHKINYLNCSTRYKNDIILLNSCFHGNNEGEPKLYKIEQIFNHNKKLQFKLDNYTRDGTYVFTPQFNRHKRSLRKIKISLKRKN